MTTRNLRWQLVGIILTVLLLSGCGAATPTSESPTSTPESPTSTPEPPTSTPEPTQTSVPPTPRPTDILVPPTETVTVVPPTPTLEPTEFPAVGTDITIDLPEGDVDKGYSLARRWGCEECHITFTHGPLFLSSAIDPSVSERAASRIEDPSYTGTATTGEEYLIESILLPRVYQVTGYENKEERYKMDEDLGERLTTQDLADILAWLLTIE